MLMQIIAIFLGFVALIITLIAQFFDWLFLIATDLAALLRHIMARLAAFLSRSPYDPR